MHQTGATVRSALVFTLLAGGVFALYLSSSRVQTLEPEGGTGAAFQAHDAQVTAELGLTGMQGATFVETAAGARVTIAAPEATECNEVLVAQANQICASHRVGSHRDNQCAVTYTFQTGSCTP